MIIFPLPATRHLPLILAAAMGYGPAEADGSQDQALRWEQATCLSKYADAYLEVNDFPSMLFVGLCPENFKPNSSYLAEKDQNSALDPSGLPRLVAGPRVPIEPRSAVVVLTREQLLCLKNAFGKVAKPDTTVLSDGQMIDVAVLDFSSCPP